MELLKKKIHQITTTGTTTGCTPCAVIIPDTTVNYYFNILLTAESHDIGFFDAYTEISGSSINDSVSFYSSQTVTGKSTSRLTELRKYTITSVFADQYINNGSPSSDGVDLYNTIPNEKIVYYLGGIRYVDILVDGVTKSTTFNFTSQGYNSPNFIDVPYYKNPNKENIISNPKIYDDVFIIRQELSAFDKNYRLEYIKNLVDLTTYAAGSFFNIVNNS
jgi:hypothetical protein